MLESFLCSKSVFSNLLLDIGKRALKANVITDIFIVWKKLVMCYSECFKSFQNCFELCNQLFKLVYIVFYLYIFHFQACTLYILNFMLQALFIITAIKK